MAESWLKILLLVASMLLNWWEVRKLRKEQAARDRAHDNRFSVVEEDVAGLKHHAKKTEQRLELLEQRP